ncbi:class I SAM-dependent RNA methyltransferase [Lujinxingia vulgaris]|uniref:Class I SAM-dependent RNA methyltransferase n=1 Tax=Lujinxingia vulgaris TaxID=2600176 RepID=A0A5C6XMY3_9DELT|nr:methyltransferase [Lujinxingia vulgaris]TXD42761.1 class I SAM-dependent RNA methyltransferase [Lujinxingia vulgaris]
MSKTIDDVVIAGIDANFEGWVEHNQRRVLAPGVVPGDRVDLEVVASSQHHPRDFARVSRVHGRGEGFEQPVCAHAGPVRGRCGGCPGMHVRASLRAQILEDRVTELLGEREIGWSWHEAPRQLGYRNRSNFVVTRRAGRLLLGSYAPRSQDVAAMSGCQVVRPILSRVQAELEVRLGALDVPVGDEAQGLRYISVRAAGQPGAGEAVVVELVVREPDAHWLGAATEAIMAIEGVQGVALTVNDRDTNAIRVDASRTLAGDCRLMERYGDVALAIDPGAFAQLNVEVASAMYRQAARWVQGAQVIWDLYCGIGGLGLNAAVGRSNVHLFGAESVASAIESARQNAARAGVEARYRVVDLGAADWRASCPDEGALARPEAILLNPPRKGLSRPMREVLSKPASLGAKMLVYMSCDVASFARDTDELEQGGWKLVELQAHDMLPQTTHVELLGRFERARGS